MTGFSELAELGIDFGVDRLRSHSEVVTDALFDYAAHRCRELGVNMLTVLGKAQGQRLDERSKEVRASIVREMQVRGYTTKQIGLVFGGRSKQSISALLEHGKQR